MKRFILGGFVLIACAAAPFAQVRDAGAKVDVSSELTAALKHNDTNGDGKIAWQEVLDLHDSRAKAAAKAEESKEPKKALDEVKLKYASLMPRLQFLLADADRDLEVTEPELRTYLLKSATEGAPKPELWHHEQMARDWVEKRWARIRGIISCDEKDSIEKFKMEMAYAWQPNDDDWNLNKDFDDGIERIEDQPPDENGWRRPSAFRVFKAEIEKVDKNGDDRVSKEEYVVFKARERMRGWWVDETAGTVEVRDAHGVLLASSENARIPDDYTPIDDEGIKLGSSWITRHYTADETYDVRHEVTYLNAQWSSVADQEDRWSLTASRRIYYEDGQFWLRMNIYQTVNRKIAEDGSPGEKVGHDANPRASNNAQGWDKEITVPAGTFKCRLSGWMPDKPGANLSYDISIGGVRIDVMHTDRDGNRKLELISIDK